MKWLYVVLGLAVSHAVAVGVGYYAKPSKTIEKTVEVVKTVRDEDAITKAIADARQEWAKEVQDHTITRVVYKEGKIVEKVVYRDVNTKSEGSSEQKETTDTTVVTHEETSKSTETTKITENAHPRFKVAITMPPQYSLSALGAEADVRVLGTLWLGARYVHQDSAPFRLAVGFEF